MKEWLKCGTKGEEEEDEGKGRNWEVKMRFVVYAVYANEHQVST